MNYRIKIMNENYVTDTTLANITTEVGFILRQFTKLYGEPLVVMIRKIDTAQAEQ